MSKNTVTVLRKLAATTSRTDKEQIILDAWMTGERDFFVGCQLAYDILISFGVAKVPELEVDDGQPGPFDFKAFRDLANKLHKRQLTGNAAREAMNQAALNSDFAEWNEFFRRILLKDLRAGISESTVNKILEKVSKSDPDALNYIVPVFSCQLAKDGADEQHAKKLKGKKMLDPKLDGVRLLTIIDKEERSVVQYTRNGKINKNFPHITKALETIIDQVPVSIVLDGEVVAKSFQDLMKMVNRKEDLDSSTAKLALFDIIPLADFKKGKCAMTQKDRHKVLSGMMGLLQQHTNGFVYVIPKITVDLDTPDGQKAYAEFNAETVKAGYEGIMVKDPEAPYETKRTSAWLKVKPFIEISMTIIGFEEGTGKNVGKLGAAICEILPCEETGGRHVISNVGSGWSDEDRNEIWINRSKYKGFILEVKADCFTKEQNSDDLWSLRFPRAKGFRGTEPGEKL
jgi:DNA ligase-1